MSVRLTRYLVGVVAGVVGLAAAGMVAAESAEDRFVASLTAAVESSPHLRAAFEDLAADEAGAEAEGGAGTPWLEVQSEGIGSSFDRHPNAQDTLRVGLPFNAPWQWSKARDYNEAVRTWVGHESRAAALDLVGAVGEEWLSLAATEERIEVVAGRVAKLEKALGLQRKRLEFGEVSGTEVMQLELAWAGEASRRDALEAGAAAARSRLTRLCSDGCRWPEPGDLEALESVGRTPGRESSDPDLASSPTQRAAESEAAAARERGDLVAGTAWGRPAFVAEWEHFPTMDGVSGYDALGLQLSVPLPFGSEGRKQKEEARGRAAAAEARARARANDLAAQVSATRDIAEGAEKRLETLVPLMAEMADAEFSLGEQFRLGAISYLVLIDGLSRLDGIELEVVDARETLLLSRLRLAVLLDDDTTAPLPTKAGAGDKENPS